MADPRASTVYTEQHADHLPFKKHSSITYTASNYDGTNHSPDIGKAVTLSGDSQAGLGSSGDYLLGALVRVESDGWVTVQVGGTFGFPYTVGGGTAPIVGRGVQVDGAGKVITPAGGNRLATERGTVLSLDATNAIAYVRF
jgi:hypothetical protein